MECKPDNGAFCIVYCILQEVKDKTEGLEPNLALFEEEKDIWRSDAETFFLRSCLMLCMNYPFSDRRASERH